MKKILIILICVLTLLTACDSFDCSINNTVALTMGFYDAEGNEVRLVDTLSVTAVGTDSVLFNRGVNRHDVSVPMSYYKDCDTLVLTLTGKDELGNEYLLRDTLRVWKTNVENFESLDCPVNMYHTIIAAEATGTFIDSVAIALPKVEYGEDENIKVYLHTAE